ncbi:MAG TPA: carboxypeptidase regulatory-like domain-containing protein [Bryocella sp.]|nr:carboxypeptidase regulatory-like domain-containing protein [Bryocella sp.]
MHRHQEIRNPGWPAVWLRAALPCCLAALLAVAQLQAQNRESLSGTVSDPSGAVVPRATVTVQNTSSGQQEKTTTAENGSYTLPQLPPGEYRLRVEAEGFAPYEQPKLELTVSAALTVDVQLKIDSDSTTVEVTDSSLQVDTTSTQLGETIGDKKMTAVPLNGRGFTDLLALQAGVVPASSAQPNAVLMAGCTNTSPSGDLNPGNLSVSGQRETANGFVVNGADVEETFGMGTAVIPNLDAIEEFRVLTSSFDAQYGNFSGGQVIVTTKSGSNQLHGSVFEFLRNTDLDARNYFSLDRAAYDQNQFGGTLGGPIKKDKTFFFVDYQGTRLTEGIDTGLITVPSLADRNGNLANLASQLTGQVSGQALADSLSQKLGYTVSPGESYYTSSCSSTSQCVFPEAIIPHSAWSTPAKNLLQYIPTPNVGDNLFSSAGENEALRDDKGAFRIDTATPWGSFSAYYFVDDYFTNNPYPTAQGGANVPGFNALTYGRSQLASFGLTKVLSTNMVNSFHFSYTRDANVVGEPVGGVGPSLVSQGFVNSVGRPSIYALNPAIEGVENVQFNDYTIGVDITGLTEANNTYEWSDDLSRTIGKHTLRFGGSFHLDQININPDATDNGSFDFTGSATGSDFADFLLGLPSTYTQAQSSKFYPRNKYFGLYGQDSWRIKSNVTLNYGLRWDILPPWREKYNQVQTLVLGEQSVVYPGAPQGLVFPGDPGIPSTLAATKYTNVAPRLGIAYSPDINNGLIHRLFGNTGTTTIHAGYGVYYTAFEGLSAGIMSANPPYGYSYTSLAPPTFADPFVNASNGQSATQPFPVPIQTSGASASHPNSNVNWNEYLPITGVPSFYPENVPPYTENYTLGVERQVTKATVLSVAYVGSQSHHQLVLIAANPGNPAECLALNAEGATPVCGPFGEGAAYTLPSGQIVQGTRGPFSSAFDAISYQKTIGNADYNALQVNLRHQSGPLEVMVAYTYSKAMDDSSSLAEAVNPIDPHLNWAISAFDLRHNFVASYRYNLPLRTLFRTDNRWTQGWSLSGVTRFTTGLPVTLFNNTDSSLLGTIPNGINNDGVDTVQVGAGNLAINTNPRNGQAAFNTALFSIPALGTMGNVPRRFFYGPGMDNFDMALQKELRVSESKLLQFRMEAFNVFNHAQFFGANAVEGNISSASFGQVINAMPPRQLQLAAKFLF